MQHTITEKTSKVEDLEGQLSGQLQRVKTVILINLVRVINIFKLLEDFEIIDSHYQSVYDKCLAALNKLEKRKIEVEHLNKVLFNEFSLYTIIYRIWQLQMTI